MSESKSGKRPCTSDAGEAPSKIQKISDSEKKKRDDLNAQIQAAVIAAATKGALVAKKGKPPASAVPKKESKTTTAKSPATKSTPTSKTTPISKVTPSSTSKSTSTSKATPPVSSKSTPSSKVTPSTTSKPASTAKVTPSSTSTNSTPTTKEESSSDSKSAANAAVQKNESKPISDKATLSKSSGRSAPLTKTIYAPTQQYPEIDFYGETVSQMWGLRRGLSCSLALREEGPKVFIVITWKNGTPEERIKEAEDVVKKIWSKEACERIIADNSAYPRKRGEHKYAGKKTEKPQESTKKPARGDNEPSMNAFTLRDNVYLDTLNLAADQDFRPPASFEDNYTKKKLKELPTKEPKWDDQKPWDKVARVLDILRVEPPVVEFGDKLRGEDTPLFACRITLDRIKWYGVGDSMEKSKVNAYLEMWRSLEQMTTDSFRKPSKDESNWKSFQDESFRKPFKDEPFRKSYRDDNYRDDTFRKPFKEDSFRKPYKDDSFRKPYKDDSFRKPFRDDSFKKTYTDDSFRKPFKDDSFRKPFKDDSFRRSSSEGFSKEWHLDEASKTPQEEELERLLDCVEQVKSDLKEARELQNKSRYGEDSRSIEAKIERLQSEEEHLKMRLERALNESNNSSTNRFQERTRKVFQSDGEQSRKGGWGEKREDWENKERRSRERKSNDSSHIPVWNTNMGASFSQQQDQQQPFQRFNRGRDFQMRGGRGGRGRGFASTQEEDGQGFQKSFRGRDFQVRGGRGGGRGRGFDFPQEEDGQGFQKSYQGREFQIRGGRGGGRGRGFDSPQEDDGQGFQKSYRGRDFQLRGGRGGGRGRGFDSPQEDDGQGFQKSYRGRDFQMRGGRGGGRGRGFDFPQQENEEMFQTSSRGRDFQMRENRAGGRGRGRYDDQSNEGEFDSQKKTWGYDSFKNEKRFDSARNEMGYGGQKKEWGYEGQKKEWGYEGQKKEWGNESQKKEWGNEGQKKEWGYESRRFEKSVGDQKKDFGYESQKTEKGFGEQKKDFGYQNQRTEKGFGDQKKDFGYDNQRNKPGYVSQKSDGRFDGQKNVTGYVSQKNVGYFSQKNVGGYNQESDQRSENQKDEGRFGRGYQSRGTDENRPWKDERDSQSFGRGGKQDYRTRQDDNQDRRNYSRSTDKSRMQRSRSPIGRRSRSPVNVQTWQSNPSSFTSTQESSSRFRTSVVKRDESREVLPRSNQSWGQLHREPPVEIPASQESKRAKGMDPRLETYGSITNPMHQNELMSLKTQVNKQLEEIKDCLREGTALLEEQKEEVMRMVHANERRNMYLKLDNLKESVNDLRSKEEQTLKKFQEKVKQLEMKYQMERNANVWQQGGTQKPSYGYSTTATQESKGYFSTSFPSLQSSSGVPEGGNQYSTVGGEQQQAGAFYSDFGNTAFQGGATSTGLTYSTATSSASNFQTPSFWSQYDPMKSSLPFQSNEANLTSDTQGGEFNPRNSYSQQSFSSNTQGEQFQRPNIWGSDAGNPSSYLSTSAGSRGYFSQPAGNVQKW